MGRAERVHPGSGGSRPGRLRPLAVAFRTGARAGDPRECSARSSGGVHDPRGDGDLGRAGPRRRDPARCGHLARPRPGGDRGCPEESGTRSGRMTQMKALVTGGAGFIGSNLVDALPTSETLPPDPISPYGVAKLAAERYCISFSRVYHSFETVALRYFNVFGPRQSPHSQYAAVVPLFIAAIDQGEPITIHGDGEQ